MSLLNFAREVLGGIGSDRFVAKVGVGFEDERGGSEVLMKGREGWLDKRGSVAPGREGGGVGGGGASMSIMLIEHFEASVLIDS